MKYMLIETIKIVHLKIRTDQYCFIFNPVHYSQLHRLDSVQNMILSERGIAMRQQNDLKDITDWKGENKVALINR